MKTINLSTKAIAIGIIYFCFLQYGQAKTCRDFLLPSSTIKSNFLTYPTLTALNIFSNPLESFTASDARLDFIIPNVKKLEPLGPPVKATLTLERAVRPKSNVSKSEYKVFDLKYVIFDSEYSIMSVSKKYRNIWSTELGKELILAKSLLEKNPDYRILLTDSGLSIWTRSHLKQWLSDYALYSLSSSSMKEFIYEATLSSPFSNSVSSNMAYRITKELETYQNFEIKNKDRSSMFNEGYRSDWLSFLYRSLFRETLLNQRLEFLKAIGKETELSKLNTRELRDALQTLAFFPEFLYQPKSVSRIDLNSEYMLSDGSIVFSTQKRSIKSFQDFNVTLKVLRSVDDVKIENLSLALIINNKSSNDISVYDALKIQQHIERQWNELSNDLNVSHKLKKGDLKFNLETQEEGHFQLVVLGSSLLSQQGLAPYLLFGLFNKL